MSKKTKLIIIGILTAILISTFVFDCSPKNEEVYSNATGNNPLNSTYLIEGEEITLTNGRSVMEIIPGSTSRLVTTAIGRPVVGELNNDSITDSALVMTQSSGGSGTFYYVAACVSVMECGNHVGTNAILLGDRVAMGSLSIKDKEIEVLYMGRNPDDPFSVKPSVPKKRIFKVEGEKLIEVK